MRASGRRGSSRGGVAQAEGGPALRGQRAAIAAAPADRQPARRATSRKESSHRGAKEKGNGHRGVGPAPEGDSARQDGRGPGARRPAAIPMPAPRAGSLGARPRAGGQAPLAGSACSHHGVKGKGNVRGSVGPAPEEGTVVGGGEHAGRGPAACSLPAPRPGCRAVRPRAVGRAPCAGATASGRARPLGPCVAAARPASCAGGTAASGALGVRAPEEEDPSAGGVACGAARTDAVPRRWARGVILGAGLAAPARPLLRAGAARPGQGSQGEEGGMDVLGS